jgi:hypothetical protein
MWKLTWKQLGVRRRENNCRKWCVKTFFLYLVDCTIFTDKSSKHIDHIFLEALLDLDMLHEWSWGCGGIGFSLPLSFRAYTFRRTLIGRYTTYWKQQYNWFLSLCFWFYISYYNMLIKLYFFSGMCFRSLQTLISIFISASLYLRHATHFPLCS